MEMLGRKNIVDITKWSANIPKLLSNLPGTGSCLMIKQRTLHSVLKIDQRAPYKHNPSIISKLDLFDEKMAAQTGLKGRLNCE